MKPLLWAVGGAAIAVVVLHQIGRARSAADSVARTLTPVGFAEAVTAGLAELRAVAGEVGEAMREQESTLTSQMLPDPADEAAARTYRAERASRARPGTEDWEFDEDF
ncbi:hypothetical protein [Serinibacter salmoneus]|uniref:Uncharacterized protein n=1 Tax=Serinibacter salmoneus TaxID=556530 RepID=A0A2A9CZS4_9MICO|nr:hypothetical protein [Serinibacter salmoneus]PFG19626.1 hypothetical protein ATL40_1194 [Serinibacter salmoneus]